MSEWRAKYGEPCRECGFTWRIQLNDAIEAIALLPQRMNAATAGATGVERRGAGWTVTGYVAHVGDNLRIWAERLAGAHCAGAVDIPGYDQDALAAVRRYNELALAGCLWSLKIAARSWVEAIAIAGHRQPVLRHTSFGELGMADIARGNLHDGLHHLWDIQQILGDAGPPAPRLPVQEDQ